MKKFLIGFFLAFSIFLVPRSVSALDVNGFDFPESVYTDLSFKSTADDIYNKLKSNSSINDLDSCIICIGSRSGSDVNLFIGVPNTEFHYSGFWGNGIVYVCDSFNGVVNYNNLESQNFVLTPNTVLPSSAPNKCNGFFLHDNVYSPCFAYANPSVNMTGYFFDSKAVFSFVAPSFSTDYEVINLPFFSLDVEGFYDWIITNNKLSELPSYILQSKLKSFLEFYKQFGSSNSSFVSKIADWFSFASIPNQTVSNINILKSSIDKLYQEYINYRSGTHAYWPGASHIQERDSIDTITDNNNTSLITDDNSDTPVISILRDILRGVIAISNNINQGVSNIISHLEQLQFTVNVVNDGVASSGIDLTPVLNKMDDILEALGSDSVSVEIDQTTKDDTDDFFDDWNLQFSTALNNKFPVASQLRTFFTGFFERCGIDADSDGDVYQYYNPGVLTASSVSRSSGTASETDIVTEFLGKFDNSDPAFLDDASYHGVPDLSVSVGGQSVSIIDFRVYAKYREKIHFIISFVIWTLYLLHLYKALPQIIGQVADVAVKTSDL